MTGRATPVTFVAHIVPFELAFMELILVSALAIILLAFWRMIQKAVAGTSSSAHPTTSIGRRLPEFHQGRALCVATALRSFQNALCQLDGWVSEVAARLGITWLSDPRPAFSVYLVLPDGGPGRRRAPTQQARPMEALWPNSDRRVASNIHLAGGWACVAAKSLDQPDR